MDRVLVLVSAVVAFGCVATDDYEVDEQTQNIVGGVNALGFPGVVDIGGCTGTVIAPRIVLSAAHCGIQPGTRTSVVDVDQRISDHTVIAVHNHRLFIDTGNVAPADVAVAHLDSDPMVEAHPFPIDAIPNLVGSEVVSVGFGANDSNDFSGGGTKRTARFVIDFQNEELIVGEGTLGEAICFGDSGGPAFLEQDGELHVVGIASRTRGCISDSGWTRVDTYASNYIIPAMDSFEGPCKFDGQCVTEGCRTPDPDCAPCGFDGICSTGCDVVDLDCPLKLPFGRACTDNEECESLVCAQTGTEPGVCSTSCSDTDPCAGDAECIDDVCFPAETVPTDSGGCGCSSTPSDASWLALLLLVGLAARVRRRSLSR